MIRAPRTSCRRCPATVGLVKWHTIMLCPECLPKKPCLNCGKVSPEVEFATPRTRRCKACMAVHTKLLRGGDAKKRKPKKSKKYKADLGRKHMVWIRSQPCLVHGLACSHMAIHAHHVRQNTGGGTGLKPSDFWCVPLCVAVHNEFHQIGRETWERKYGIDLRAEAVRLAAASPYLIDSPYAVTYPGQVNGAIDVGFGPNERGKSGGNAPG